MTGVYKGGGQHEVVISRKFQYQCTDAGRQGEEIAFAWLTFSFFPFYPFHNNLIKTLDEFSWLSRG